MLGKILQLDMLSSNIMQWKDTFRPGMTLEIYQQAPVTQTWLLKAGSNTKGRQQNELLDLKCVSCFLG